MTTVTSDPDNARPVKADRRWTWVADEVEWFLNYTRAGAEEMSRILGVRRETLRRNLTQAERLNRPDLWQRLRDRDVLAGRVRGISDDEWEEARTRGHMP